MQLELSLNATGLRDVVFGSGKADPYAVVTRLCTDFGGQPTVVGKTEVIKNTLSPEWVKTFILDYDLGKPLKLAISIFHNANTPMGSAVFEVDEILGSRGQTKAKRLRQGGNLYAHCRKHVGSGLLRLHIQGSCLKNTEGLMRTSDPFFEISRQVDNAGGLTWDNVYRSQIVNNNLDPNWDSVVLELSSLCGGDYDFPIRLSVYDHEPSGKHKLMGQIVTSVLGLQNAVGSSMTLEMQGRKTGLILIKRAEVWEPELAASSDIETEKATPLVTDDFEPTFLDYIMGGLEINVVVAIDFTGSNGDPRKPGTLHHITESMNCYEKVISSILGILSKYDSDKNFPVLGFGAKYDGIVRHAFQVGPQEEAQGVDGVLNAYRSVFKSGLVMSSPTSFVEVMKIAAARAKSLLDAARQKERLAYTVLLIVTDGAVSDVNATVECLEGISDSPLSIVLVGVGDADFSDMAWLDNANGINRDLTQFVQFNKHPHKDDLTAVTLREIPNQLVGFFQGKGINPGKLVVIEEEEIAIDNMEEDIDLSLAVEADIVITGGGVDLRDAW